MGKLNYKNFNFNKKEDYLYGLYLVISAAYQGINANSGSSERGFRYKLNIDSGSI